MDPQIIHELMRDPPGYDPRRSFKRSSPAYRESLKVSLLAHRSQVRQGIGYLSTLITTLEDHPFPFKLNRNGTYFEKLQCDAAYDESLPAEYRSLVAKAGHDDAALAEVQQYLIQLNPNLYKAKLGTTQAIDLISGGVKVNALPEHVSAVANHRIADWRSVACITSS